MHNSGEDTEGGGEGGGVDGLIYKRVETNFKSWPVKRYSPKKPLNTRSLQEVGPTPSKMWLTTPKIHVEKFSIIVCLSVTPHRRGIR